jgi:hypothetical protein
MGRFASVSFTFNDSNRREKIKFVLGEGYASGVGRRPVLHAAVAALQETLVSCIVTDKGHKSISQKQPVVEFWIQQAPHVDVVGDGMHGAVVNAVEHVGVMAEDMDDEGTDDLSKAVVDSRGKGRSSVLATPVPVEPDYVAEPECPAVDHYQDDPICACESCGEFVEAWRRSGRSYWHGLVCEVLPAWSTNDTFLPCKVFEVDAEGVHVEFESDGRGYSTNVTNPSFLRPMGAEGVAGEG